MTQRQNSLFLGSVPIVQFFKNTTFRKPALLPSLDTEAPNLVDPLDRAILSHWAPQKQSTEKEILSVTEKFVPDEANRSF
jgi:hypothetical protein